VSALLLRSVVCAVIAAYCCVPTAAADTHFVSLTGSHSEPYTNWLTAATNLQAAINCAVSGDTVLVSAGVYRLSNTVVVTNSIEVRSTEGAANTTVDGNGTCSCFYINASTASVDGFTMTKGIGYAESEFSQGTGGGACCLTGAVRCCVIISNTASFGGGLFCGKGALIEDCVLEGNRSVYGGGGVALRGGVVRRCVISENSGDLGPGGCVLYEGVVENCLIVGNSGTGAGGVYLGGGTESAWLRTCTVVANTSVGSGGGGVTWGAWGGTPAIAENCIIYFNEAPEEPNCSGGTAYECPHCCTTADLPPTEFNFLAYEQMGIITNDPQLTPSYRLKSTSPCIDAGTSSNAPAMDTDGEARWDHPDHSNTVSIVDIGADEFVDTDLDHMADHWEIERLGSVTNSDGSRDGDFDDLTDLAEYEHGTDPKDSDTDDDRMSDGHETAADTDPLDSNSWLGITGIAREDGDVRITWKGGQDVTQVLEWRTDLPAVSDTWTAVRTVAPPTPVTNSVLQSVSTNSVGYYRIRVVE